MRSILGDAERATNKRLLTRQVTTSTNYHGLVRLSPSGHVKLEARRNAGGTETTLDSAVTVSGLTASANSYLRVRVQITGTTPTTVKVRVWADGSTEPTTWQVSQTDSTAILQQAGVVGLRTQLTSGATNAPVTGSWDDWLVTVLASDPSLALAPSYDDSFGYDVLGNLTNKDGVVQQYGATGTGAHPHAATTIGGAAYSYDANGNLLSGGGRTLTWNAENQPSQVVVSGGVTEQYSYDADGARVTRSATPGLSTRFAFGLYELEGSVTRSYYALAGQVVALRDSGLGLSYLYGDHLGSISVSTSATGQRQGVQYFDAWGKKLSGSVSQTKRSYTGQYLDDSGLLFYNARYYDPGIGRFVSADTISPGKDDPQNRNRYSYTINNPLKYIDPTGHCVEGSSDQTLEGCYAYVAAHGWLLQLSDWTYDTLLIVAESIRDLKAAAGWDTGSYVSTMSGNGTYTLQLKRAASYIWDSNRPADVAQRGNSITMTVYDALFRDTKDMQRFNMVHEQAHVWDAATGGALSGNMMKATGSGYTWWGQYQPKGATSSTYLTTHREDWADTVAAAVYPDNPRSKDPATGNPRMGTMRQNYIKGLLPHAALFNGTYMLNQAQ